MTMTSAPVRGPGHRPPTWVWILLALSVAVVAGLAVLTVAVVRDLTTGTPAFPSLAQSPDPSLHGTVAYTDGANCVRIRAAAGQPDRQVTCLPQDTVAVVEALGKQAGTALAWRDDGRLEVTVLRMPWIEGGQDGKRPGGDLVVASQLLVDTRTGEVEQVPDAELPTTPPAGTRPTTSPSGDTVAHTSDPESGRVTVTLTSSTGAERTLLAATGPHPYNYGMHAAFWAPTFDWIAADDGRLLVVTPGDPPTTRILVDLSTSSDPTIARFAVTGEDLLTSGP